MSDEEQVRTDADHPADQQGVQSATPERNEGTGEQDQGQAVQRQQSQDDEKPKPTVLALDELYGPANGTTERNNAPGTATNAQGEYEDRLPDAQWRAMPIEARRAFAAQRSKARELRQKLSERENFARYGEELMKVTEELGLDEAGLIEAVTLAAHKKAGNQKYLGFLEAEAQRLGLQQLKEQSSGGTQGLDEDLQSAVDLGYLKEQEARTIAQARQSQTSEQRGQPQQQTQQVATPAPNLEQQAEQQAIGFLQGRGVTNITAHFQQNLMPLISDIAAKELPGVDPNNPPAALRPKLVQMAQTRWEAQRNKAIRSGSDRTLPRSSAGRSLGTITTKPGQKPTEAALDQLYGPT